MLGSGLVIRFAPITVAPGKWRSPTVSMSTGPDPSGKAAWGKLAGSSATIGDPVSTIAAAVTPLTVTGTIRMSVTSCTTIGSPSVPV
jgi:hypothetical protein